MGDMGWSHRYDEAENRAVKEVKGQKKELEEA